MENQVKNQFQRTSFEARKQFCDDAKRAAIGRFVSLLKAAGVAENCLSGRPSPCPACGGRDRFTFDDQGGRGTFYCRNCGAGDGLTLIRKVRSLGHVEACEFIADALGGITFDAPAPTLCEPIKPLFDLQKAADIQNAWNSSRVLRCDDRGHRYLTMTRKIPLPTIPVDLHHIPNGLLIGFRNANGDLVQVQKITLDENGQKYGWRPKLFMPSPGPGLMRLGSVRLFEAGEHLAIGEGVETCLAWHSKNDKVPVWAALSRTLLESVMVPPSVRRVSVLSDHDASGDGLRSAQRLAERLFKEGRQVRILMPEKLGTDFADELQ